MADAPVLGTKDTVALDDDVFGAPFNEALVHECVRAELNARRRGSASTRTRGKVRGGGAKPWRQKGTGRARAGSIRSPIWAGGGTVFGPSPRRYTVKVNRKARRAALRSALSLHAGRDSIAVVRADDFAEPSTKKAAGALADWSRTAPTAPTLVLLDDDALGAGRSFRNLAHVDVRAARAAGIADLMRAARVVATEAALEDLVRRARKERATAEEAA